MITGLRIHDFTHTVDTMPPKVCVGIVYHREPNDKWLLDAMESLSVQSYPNVECITVDNRDNQLTIAAARNSVVSNTDAPFVLFLCEEDMLAPDSIACLVSMHQVGKSTAPTLVHTTHKCVVILENGQLAISELHAPGLYERDYLLSNPFDADLTQRVDLNQMVNLRNLALLVKGPTSWCVAHHYGYQLREHMFRRDGITIGNTKQARA